MPSSHASSVYAYFAFKLSTNYTLATTEIGRGYGDVFLLGFFLGLSFLFVPFVPFIFSLQISGQDRMKQRTLKSKAPGRVVFTSPTVACLYLPLALIDRGILQAVQLQLTRILGDREYLEQFLISRALGEVVGLTCQYTSLSIVYLLGGFLEFSRRHYISILQVWG